MEVSEIIKQVRWCIDEEAVNIGGIQDINNDVLDNDDAYMDNIIMAKIFDALRWCMQFAPNDLLNSDGTPGVSADKKFVRTTTTTVVSGTPCVITLPEGFQRLVRVRLSDWKKAVCVPIEEDSDKYLELSDATAQATNDRPVAALIRTDPMKLELWPGGEADAQVSYSYVCVPSYGSSSLTDSTDIYIPEKLKSAFLYYIAFLLLSAYGDGRASVMLSIAKMNLGQTT